MINSQPPSHSGSPCYISNLIFWGFSHHLGTFILATLVYLQTVHQVQNPTIKSALGKVIVDCWSVGPVAWLERKCPQQSWHPMWGLLISSYCLCCAAPFLSCWSDVLATLLILPRGDWKVRVCFHLGQFLMCMLDCPYVLGAVYNIQPRWGEEQ